MQLFGVQLHGSGVPFAHATGATLLACSLILIVLRNARASHELVAFLRRRPRIFSFLTPGSDPGALGGSWPAALAKTQGRD